MAVNTQMKEEKEKSKEEVAKEEGRVDVYLHEIRCGLV